MIDAHRRHDRRRRAEAAEFAQRLRGLAQLRQHQHDRVAARGEEVKPEAHHKRADEQDRERGRLAGPRDAKPHQEDAEGHDAHFREVNGDEADQEAHQPRHLAHRLDQAHLGRADLHALDGEVVEECLPDLKPEIKHEVREDYVDEHTTVVNGAAHRMERLSRPRVGRECCPVAPKHPTTPGRNQPIVIPLTPESKNVFGDAGRNPFLQKAYSPTDNLPARRVNLNNSTKSMAE